MADTAPDAVRRARAYLLRVAKPPAVSVTAFIEAHGPLEAAARVRAGKVPDPVRQETASRHHLDLVDEDFACAARVGARLVMPEDDEWSTSQITALSTAATHAMPWAAPPVALWVRGQPRLTDVFDRAVSVIGARTATPYGEHLATEIGYTLGTAGITVASGAAYGIDGATHRGALKAEGMTVAVLGCGIDITYPAGHANLLDSIVHNGLILTEYAPTTNPARHRFLARNRLIAALSTATVVVEAGQRSSARNTATTAAALGKAVLAVPGPITSAMSVGCHDLIRSGTAQLVGSVPDILEAAASLHTGLRSHP